MCYERRDEEFAKVCLERDELRKRLADREAFHEACQRVANRELNRLRAERDLYIERKRWIVRRRHDDAIMCGTARNYQFRKESEIGDAKICTYMSEKKAYAAASMSYGYDETKVVAECVAEVISTY